MSSHWACSKCKKNIPNHKWFCTCGNTWGDKAAGPRSKGRRWGIPVNSQQVSKAQQLELGRIAGKILQAAPEAAHNRP
eukprot:6806810-Pyramimonas_sp.AAC.1